MCGLKEIFEGAGNFCDKKVPCKSHFSIREKLNLIRFIKTLYKNLSTHPSLRDTFSTGEKALNHSVKPAVCYLPFRNDFRIGFQFDKFIFIKHYIFLPVATYICVLF